MKIIHRDISVGNLMFKAVSRWLPSKIPPCTGFYQLCVCPKQYCCMRRYFITIRRVDNLLCRQTPDEALPVGLCGDEGCEITKRLWRTR